MIRAFALSLALAALGLRAASAGTITFDDLSLAPDSAWNGPDPSGTVVGGPYGDVVAGSFSSGGANFGNRYDTTYGSWSGFAYSNVNDTSTPGWTNQFAAIAGSGRGPGQDNYGVAFGYRDLDRFDPTDPAHLRGLPSITMPAGAHVAGMHVTNATYAALSMRDGDGFAGPFGGTTGDDPDWFKLSAYGIDALGNVLSTQVDFYLADFRFDDNSLDYIVDSWVYMDLSALGGAHTLHFNLSSSDVGAWGMNTPAYFAVDDIIYTTPEPATLAMCATGLLLTGLLARRNRR